MGKNMRNNYLSTKAMVFGMISLLVAVTMVPVVDSIFSYGPYETNNRKNEKNEIEEIPPISSSAGIKYYAIMAACSKYKDPRMNLPKFPFPSFPEWKLKIFYNALIGADNWDENNIILLLNDDASRQNIIDALGKMAKMVGPKDIFLFSWFGHGYQVPDYDGDESAVDPNDESDEIIAPYDCYQDSTGTISNYITDDELGRYFSRINCKGMCLIFESCLSGGLIDTNKQSTTGQKTPNLLDTKLFTADFMKDMDEETATTDVNGNNRVVIMSCHSETLGKASFLIGAPLQAAMALVFTRGHTHDSNGDSCISAEEAYSIARPLTLLQSLLYWVGNWIWLYIYFQNDLYHVIPFKKAPLVEKLFDRPGLSASYNLILSFIVLQLKMKIQSGHFMLNWPNISDNYEGELPIIVL